MGLMLKGFEVELFTGRADGEVVGLADRIAPRLDGFVLEPDSRNLEYTTPPLEEYPELLRALVEPRARLRGCLRELGDYHIVPGSSMPLDGATRKFVRSDPGNPYHDRIEQAYGTRVVTSSIHVNFGMQYAEDVIRATRLLRMDAAVLLALSASSPFQEGQPTGYHSTRWETFPKTPEHVPLFVDHQDYVDWMTRQLALGTMWNVRHLWSAARPNGPDRPHDINRVELRVCDLICDPRVLIGVTEVVEHRLQRLLEGQQADPLASPRYGAAELVALAHRNERNVARHSLDALVEDWETGDTVTARALAKEWVDALRISSRTLTAFDEFMLRSVDAVLDGGNEAMRWLRQVERGASVAEVVAQAVRDCDALDEMLARQYL